MDKVFREGVTGHAREIESASVADCSSGDDYTTFTYNLCCPGDECSSRRVSMITMIMWRTVFVVDDVPNTVILRLIW